MRQKGQFKTHEMSKTRLYKEWQGIRQRCNNPKASNYKNYGAKGVSVCKEWESAFEPFMQWALSNGYSDNLTIDRIDVNGDYEPDNCRWITQQ